MRRFPMFRATVRTPDRPQLVIELTPHGASRNVGAKTIGCAPSTVIYTALRDRHVAAAIFRA